MNKRLYFVTYLFLKKRLLYVRPWLVGTELEHVKVCVDKRLLGSLILSTSWITCATHNYNNPSQIYYLENHIIGSSPMIQLCTVLRIWYRPQLFWNKTLISIVALPDTPIVKDGYFIISHKDHKAMKKSDRLALLSVENKRESSIVATVFISMSYFYELLTFWTRQS